MKHDLTEQQASDLVENIRTAEYTISSYVSADGWNRRLMYCPGDESFRVYNHGRQVLYTPHRMFAVQTYNGQVRQR